jgi:putative DNA primase/helicase
MPAGVDGQVQRAGRRFAWVAVAGELATACGITGWPRGEVAAACATMFRLFLSARGGVGSREDMQIITALRRFIGLHGSARFEPLRQEGGDEAGAQNEAALPEGPKTILRAGWRWQEATEIGERAWIYGMLPDVFDAEVAGPLGMEGRDARARLGKAGLIRSERTGGETRWKVKQRIPGHGRPRLIVINAASLDGDAA